MKYWRWLAKGSGGRAGYSRFLNWWLVLHVVSGGVLSWAVPVTAQVAANTVLMPLAGIFVGLCFAWGGNANALLQTSELEELSANHPGGLQEYVFVYQSAILTILITLCAWGLAGLGIVDQVWPGPCEPELVVAVRGCLFFLASLTLRECWHVVLGAQSMLLVRKQIREAKSASDRAVPRGGDSAES